MGSSVVRSRNTKIHPSLSRTVASSPVNLLFLYEICLFYQSIYLELEVGSFSCLKLPILKLNRLWEYLVMNRHWKFERGLSIL